MGRAFFEVLAGRTSIRVLLPRPGVAVLLCSALLAAGASPLSSQYVPWIDFYPDGGERQLLPGFVLYEPFEYPWERAGGAVGELVGILREYYRSNTFRGDGPWSGLKAKVGAISARNREYCVPHYVPQPERPPPITRGPNRRTSPLLEPEPGEICLGETEGILCNVEAWPESGDTKCDGLEERAALLTAAFEAALAERPDLHWVRAQHVYWLVKRRELPRASELAFRCPGEDWRCYAMRAHVRYHEGAADEAEAFWDQALSRMPERDRCYWTDLRELFEVDFRGDYETVGCEEREPLNRQIWWLGDPFWLLDGNARRVEHFDRIFRAALVDGLGRTGGQTLSELVRHNWVKEGHFDAWVERHDLPITRRGTGGHPTFGRLPQDASPLDSRWFEPVSSARYHFLPSEAILDDPLHTTPEDWDLILGLPEGGAIAPPWGSKERFSPHFGPVYQLDKQSAAFLREDAMAVVIATSTAGLPGFAGARSLPGVAWMRSEDDEMRTTPLVEQGFGSGRWVARLVTEPFDALFSVEVITSEHGAARVRFGEGPPDAPLDARLRASDILLFDPSGGLPADLGAAADQALPSHRVPQGSAVGAFWELYGQRPQETISYSIRVVPTDASTLERLGRAIRLIDPEPVITTTFEATAPDDPAPVEPRGLEIDVSELVPGSYRLEIDAWSAMEGRVLRLSTPLRIEGAGAAG